MFCLDCKVLVLRGDNCTKCGLPLPGTQPLPRVDFKGPDVKKLTLGYRCGDVSRDEVLEYLERQDTAIWATYEELEESKFAPDVFQELREELETGRRGLLLFARALEMLREWLDTGTTLTLKTALALTAQSDELVNDAMQMNYATSRMHVLSMQEYLRGLNPEV